MKKLLISLVPSLFFVAFDCKADFLQPPAFYDPTGSVYRTGAYVMNSIQQDAARMSSVQTAPLEATRSGRDRGDTTRVSTGSNRASTVLSRLEPISGPRKMASAYPEKNRAQVEQVFQNLLKSYHQIERQFGIQEYDVAGALASFLAGSYMAYRNVEFPDEHFKPLVSQMRQIISSNPEFLKATGPEKQDMYEQMAILGMFMATTQMALKENPSAQTAASMKQAAKGYLEQFLKTDADRVQITAQGLQIR